MAFWNGSLIANVVELSVSSVHEVKLHRIACVADCGLSINPDSVAAQMQGGIVFGLTTAFLSEITIEDGRVQQSNFDGFPLAALAQVPDIDVTVLPSDEKSAGAGEVGVAAIAPALANAIFSATGKRIRRMPFKQDGFTDEGKVKGRFVATGFVPKFYDDLQRRGVAVNMNIFRED